MTTQRCVFDVVVPDFCDLNSLNYPRAVGRAQGSYRFLWDVITAPENVVRAIHVAETGVPGISGVAEIISQAVAKSGLQMDAQTKQLAGVFVSAVLQSNGFRKVGRTSVAHPDFSQATLFSR